MEIIFWILVGAFIGWNLPEPDWAKNLSENIKNYFNK